MKIIQINGWLGRLNGPLARFLEQESPDIVCLQEALQPKAEDLPTFRDQYSYLSELQSVTKMPNLFFAPAWGFKMAGTTIDVGLAILTKHKLTDPRHFNVNNEYYVARAVDDYRRNTRAFQSAVVETMGGKRLAIANYQGYLAGAHAAGDDVSVSLMKKIAEALGSLPRPLIFCGDLNVAPDTETIRALKPLGLRNLVIESGVKTTLSQVHRAPEPDRSSVICDYIFTSSEISVTKFEVSQVLVSDHKALILEFNL